MENVSTEVLMYCMTVKEFFKKNEEAKKYFIKNDKLYDQFFSLLEIKSQNNFIENGDPTLTTLQFEEIRSKLNEVELMVYVPNNIFYEIPKFGKVCLN